MTLALLILLFLAILFIAVIVRWRLASRHSTRPCPSWLAWLIEKDNPRAKNYNAHSIIERLALQPGMRVLDAGCGPGRITIPLARAIGAQGEVVALDIQPRMLQRAKDKAQAAGLTNIKFLEMAIEAGKLGSNEYDRVVLVAVLGEIPDRQSALQEIHRALKPGGILSVSEIIFDPHYQSRRAILKLASPAGFREEAFFGNRFAFTVHLEKSKEG
jgi:ubiquinone/menaquinone biosynthesis C-methylase UbiE